MNRDPNVAELIRALSGTWLGSGSGGYPTIDPFDYREETVIKTRPDHPALHYEQRAWKHTPDGEAVSHWETGLIRLGSDGSAAVYNGQGRRAEALHGRWAGVAPEWKIELEAEAFSGDNELIRATRAYEVSHTSMRYEMWMHTVATEELLMHLTADLAKRA